MKFAALALALTVWIPVEALPHQADTSNADTVNVILRLERQWERALKNADFVTINRIVAKDCVFVITNGRIVPRNEALLERQNRLSSIESSTIMEISVRALGDAAVVVGLTREISKSQEGYRHSWYRWTDVFAQIEDRWQLVSTQSTPATVESINR